MSDALDTIEQGGLELARWTVSEEEWQAWLTRDQKRGRKEDGIRLAMGAMLGAFAGYAVWKLIGPAAPQIALVIGGGIAGLLIALGIVQNRSEVEEIVETGPREVILKRAFAWVGNRRIDLPRDPPAFGVCVTSAEVVPGPPPAIRILLMQYVGGLPRPANTVARYLPIPADGIDAAERALRRFRDAR